MQPAEAAEAFDRLADIVIAIGPPAAVLIGLVLLQVLSLCLMVTPAVWMTFVVVRATGWRGAAFMGLLWSTAWRIAAGS